MKQDANDDVLQMVHNKTDEDYILYVKAITTNISTSQSRYELVFTLHPAFVQDAVADGSVDSPEKVLAIEGNSSGQNDVHVPVRRNIFPRENESNNASVTPQKMCDDDASSSSIADNQIGSISHTTKSVDLCHED